MGYGRWDNASRATYTTAQSNMVGKTMDQVYKSRTMKDGLDPKGVDRESRDSNINPESTPIIVALDVTGSMGMLADSIAREGLGVLFDCILEKKPVTDPHLMFMAIGDVNYDTAPLQVSQFEADSTIIQQLTDMYLEKGGGGNQFESYNMPWYFAAHHTEHDAKDVRNRTGYLFTVGDEQAPEPLTPDQIRRFIGDDSQDTMGTPELLELCRQKYDTYHIIIEEGSHARHHPNEVKISWNNLMGQNVISLADHKKLADTIVSTIQAAEGHKVTTGSTAVAAAVSHLEATATETPAP